MCPATPQHWRHSTFAPSLTRPSPAANLLSRGHPHRALARHRRRHAGRAEGAQPAWAHEDTGCSSAGPSCAAAASPNPANSAACRCPTPPPSQAGACYVPLDPSYAPDRLAGYLEDAGAAVLLTQAALEAQAHDLCAAAGAAGAATPSVLLLEEAAAIGGEGDGACAAALPPPSDNDCAYTMFTSGSTVRLVAPSLLACTAGRVPAPAALPLVASAAPCFRPRLRRAAPRARR